MYQPLTGTGAGTAPVVNLPWPYLDKAHVNATVSGSPVSFTWTGASQITFAATVPNGSPWEVSRATLVDEPLVDFTDGAVLTEADLALSQAQSLYRLEELQQPTVNGTPLAAASGSGLVGFIFSGVGAVARTVLDKLRDVRHVKDYGVIADGVTDDTAAMQAAVTAAVSAGRALRLPDRGVIRLTATINASGGLRLLGDGVNPYQGFLNVPGGNVRGPGTWFYLDHTGVGFSFSGSGQPISGVNLEGFGTYRNQPAPAPGWSANDHGFDIYLESAEAHLDNLVFLNATRGIKADKGDYGKFTATRIRGQFMKVGIQLDKQYDAPFISNFRSWSYWADQSDVLAYTKANLDTLYLLRSDNPQLSNIFSINHRSALRIGQSSTAGAYPGGTTSKLKVTNLDGDIGKYPLWIDSTVTSGAQVDIVNFSAQCDNLSGSNPVMIEGSNNLLSVHNPDLRFADENAIRISGTSGNKVTLTGRIHIDGYNHAATGFPAIEVDTGNTLTLLSDPTIVNGGGAPSYGGTGTINKALVKAAAQADSTAPDVATLKADFNALLAKLRAANHMA